MRWLYYNPDDPVEAAEHSRTIAAIDRWWTCFANAADQIAAVFTKQQSDFDIAAFMLENLQAIDPRICWEFGPGPVKGGHRLVITSETHRDLRPMIQELVSRAPDLAGWEFYTYRLAESVEMAIATVQGRVGAALEGTRVRVSIGDHRKVNLNYSNPDWKGPEDEQANGVAFVATETLLSEKTLDQWIGYIDIDKVRRPGLLSRIRGRGNDPKLLPLDRLKPTVDALIDSLREQLPAAPLHKFDDVSDATPLSAKAGAWTLLQADPPQQASYPGRTDIMTLASGVSELSLATMNDPAFFSHRFSRHGETFCYLKIDATAWPFEQRAALREPFENAVDNGLRRADLGCMFAAGSGLVSSYLDLALVDVDRALPVLRDACKSVDVSQVAWLLFFDADLCGEWVGMNESTPPPPHNGI